MNFENIFNAVVNQSFSKAREKIYKLRPLRLREKISQIEESQEAQKVNRAEQTRCMWLCENVFSFK